jgi:hypothetical protein
VNWTSLPMKDLLKRDKYNFIRGQRAEEDLSTKENSAYA